MGESLYSVKMGKSVVGKDMSLEFALIFIKGIFETYYSEVGLELTIEKTN